MSAAWVAAALRVDGGSVPIENPMGAPCSILGLIKPGTEGCVPDWHWPATLGVAWQLEEEVGEGKVTRLGLFASGVIDLEADVRELILNAAA